MNQTSSILEEAIYHLNLLPGIGKKTALRLALHLAAQDKSKAIQLGETLIRLGEKLIRCKSCFAYSDTELCSICSDEKRDPTILCIVESIRDLFAIEDTETYRGKYHVLGGLISPIDGVGPEKLNLSNLFGKVETGKLRELILAIRPTIEGDTTAYFICKNLKDPEIKVSMLARGVAFGSELEFADELTLSRSMVNRIPYPVHDNPAV